MTTGGALSRYNEAAGNSGGKAVDDSQIVSLSAYAIWYSLRIELDDALDWAQQAHRQIPDILEIVESKPDEAFEAYLDTLEPPAIQQLMLYSSVMDTASQLFNAWEARQKPPEPDTGDVADFARVLGASAG